jgi:hypothetical protein
MMKPADSRLQRLLRAAASAPTNESPAAMPFGFDTRVVALSRGNRANGGNGILRLVRRVAVAASIILVISGAASVREFQVAEDIVEPTSNEYAIADTAIEDELLQ